MLRSYAVEEGKITEQWNGRTERPNVLLVFFLAPSGLREYFTTRKNEYQHVLHV